MIGKVRYGDLKNQSKYFSLEDNVYSSYLVIESYICTFFLFPIAIVQAVRMD